MIVFEHRRMLVCQTLGVDHQMKINIPTITLCVTQSAFGVKSRIDGILALANSRNESNSLIAHAGRQKGEPTLASALFFN